MMAGRWEARALARALLLAFVVLGVALMHTLGHEHDGSTEMSMPAVVSASAHSSGHDMLPSVLGMADHSTGGVGGSRVPLDPASACIATLVAFGAVVGLRMVFRYLVSSAECRSRVSALSPTAKDPPRPFSITLTRVVVLLT
ncbi:hypothetical protein ACOZ38_24925 [Sphaerisporangium viridialbum]|uniref:hypothetical protein n=1 Tax=Sphaerisporangium viridialbum TaxID=46189 RepID=UPI003C74FF80